MTGVWLGCAIRLTFSIKGAEQIVVNIPVNVITHKKIEGPIVVVIKPKCTGGETVVIDSGFSRDINKATVTLSAEEVIWTDRCEIDVNVTVVVVIGGSSTDAINGDVQARRIRDVCEGAVSVVLIQSCSRLTCFC